MKKIKAFGGFRLVAARYVCYEGKYFIQEVRFALSCVKTELHTDLRS